MTEHPRVSCLVDRYWDPAAMAYAGTETTGALWEISVRSDREDGGRLTPIGVVLTDDGRFELVPLEFITQIDN